MWFGLLTAGIPALKVFLRQRQKDLHARGRSFLAPEELAADKADIIVSVTPEILTGIKKSERVAC
jgi:hypothetical protein